MMAIRSGIWEGCLNVNTCPIQGISPSSSGSGDGVPMELRFLSCEIYAYMSLIYTTAGPSNNKAKIFCLRCAKTWRNCCSVSALICINLYAFLNLWRTAFRSAAPTYFPKTSWCTSGERRSMTRFTMVGWNGFSVIDNSGMGRHQKMRFKKSSVDELNRPVGKIGFSLRHSCSVSSVGSVVWSILTKLTKAVHEHPVEATLILVVAAMKFRLG